MPLNLRSHEGSPLLVKLLNLGLRVLQMLFSATIIGLYASQLNNLGLYTQKKHMVLAETVGCISLVTAVIFAAIPFIISYYYVAILFIWDWIIFFIWCAAFATQHAFYGDKRNKQALKHEGVSGIDRMDAAQWLVLATMLLQLCSAIMGLVCLVIDRKSLFMSRAVV